MVSDRHWLYSFTVFFSKVKNYFDSTPILEKVVAHNQFKEDGLFIMIAFFWLFFSILYFSVFMFKVGQ